ncbi:MULTISPECIES: hypothetical protein [Sulfolobaceae]|uniref:hypothetical protein n=1 Tax=Sulfolobaceae TaxID=118883 RepID=UPI00317941A6
MSNIPTSQQKTPSSEELDEIIYKIANKLKELQDRQKIYSILPNLREALLMRYIYAPNVVDDVLVIYNTTPFAKENREFNELLTKLLQILKDVMPSLPIQSQIRLIDYIERTIENLALNN